MYVYVNAHVYVSTLILVGSMSCSHVQVPRVSDELMENMMTACQVFSFPSSKIYIGRQGDLMLIFRLSVGQDLSHEDLDKLADSFPTCESFLPNLRETCEAGLIWKGANVGDAFCFKVK